MTGVVRVDTDGLIRHVSRTRPVADALDSAGAAADAVRLHDGAFGLLCAFVPAAVSDLEVRAGDAVVKAGRALEGLGDEVAAMARLYEAVDGDVHDRLVRVLRRLA